MRKIIGTILVIASLGLGYMGVTKVEKNDASVEILDLDIDLSNKSGKEQGYMYIGLAVVMFLGGIYTLNKK